LLPGHGTRPGDLLTIRLDDWTDTVQYLIAQAADDHEHVITVGFSLGALLTLTEALKNDSRIDAMITISPAFYLTTSPWARLTVYLHPFVPWLDKEKPVVWGIFHWLQCRVVVADGLDIGEMSLRRQRYRH
jgi:alpha-beta hydrolase superfamily lysophospholipase